MRGCDILQLNLRLGLVSWRVAVVTLPFLLMELRAMFSVFLQFYFSQLSDRNSDFDFFHLSKLFKIIISVSYTHLTLPTKRIV